MHYQPLKRASLPTIPCLVNGFLQHKEYMSRLSITASTITKRSRGSTAVKIMSTSPGSVESPSETLNVSDKERENKNGYGNIVKQMRIKGVTLRQILEDDNGFNEFARHLTKEFCIENLLFILELQQCLISLNLESDKIESSDLNVLLPENAPKSQIVSTKDIYLQFAELFKKYIANDAYFCVNISGGTRGRFYEKLEYDDKDNKKSMDVIVNYLKEKDDMDKYALFELFDDARREIFELMNFAFVRFRKTGPFQEIAAKLVDAPDP